MEPYLKPSLEVVVFDEDETILAGGCCEGGTSNSYTILLPEV